LTHSPRPVTGLRFFLRKEAYEKVLNHSAKYLEPYLNAAPVALSDATRRRILARLARGGASVSDLAAPCVIPLPGVS
jgi:hypothetical protein